MIKVINNLDAFLCVFSSYETKYVLMHTDTCIHTERLDNIFPPFFNKMKLMLG